MKLKEFQACKIKKFDRIELVNGTKTVDFIELMKGINFMVINFMDKSRLFCITDEMVEVYRDSYYAITHKHFVIDINKLI